MSSVKMTKVALRSLESIKNPPAKQDGLPEPNSCWLVIVECRHNVVRVCASGKGFYIPGQEPCWDFSHVDKWIKQIWPDERLI